MWFIKDFIIDIYNYLESMNLESLDSVDKKKVYEAVNNWYFKNILKWVGHLEPENVSWCKNFVDLYIKDKWLTVKEDVSYDRICSDCWKPMESWFCIDWWAEYYCSEECLYKHYTPEERTELYNYWNSESYWTERED